MIRFSLPTMRNMSCMIAALLIAAGCSSTPEKQVKKQWMPEEERKISSVKVVRNLFDVVGCKRVGELNVRLEGDDRKVPVERLKIKASDLGADTVNELRYIQGQNSSEEAFVLGEAYKCRG